MIELLVLCAALSNSLIAAFAILALARSQSTMRAVVSDALKEIRTITSGLLTLKGTPAHVVDPSTFAPSGMSWDAVQKAREEAERIEDMEEQSRLRGHLQDLEQAKEYMTRGDAVAPPDIDEAIRAIEARLKERA